MQVSRITLQSPTLTLWFGFAAILSCVFVFTTPVFAQEGQMTFTVTPPLFQLNLQPGETWTSGIQVVNGNPYDITVFAEPVLFEPTGEGGRPSFKTPPGANESGGIADESTLAGWITLPRAAISVRREQTHILPIAISVPEDAQPGGHYAAILIGNRAPQGTADGSTVSVSSSIASLIFLRVAGTVIEDGRIRDFVTAESIYENAEARLSLRFENQGNVHLQPQGNIVIFNMFGKERGRIPINQGGDYGNVLPNSIRKFTFTWKSDSGWWDIGRYKAEATLGYGADSKQFAQATTYFYVLPFVPLAQILGSIIALILFMGWALRAYVRRALAMEATRFTPTAATATVDTKHASVQPAREAEPQLKLSTLVRPIQAGIVDLRSVGKEASISNHTSTEQETYVPEKVFGFTDFIRTYRLFFLFVFVIAAGWFAASIFFSDVLTLERAYEVTEERSDGPYQIPVDNMPPNAL